MRLLAIVVIGVLLLGGCAGPVQQPVQLSEAVLRASGNRIGVAMTALPKVDVRYPGAGCLLCLMAASVANASLSTHAESLPYEDLPRIKDYIAKGLRGKGVTAAVIGEAIQLDDLPSADGNTPNIAKKDHASLQKKYEIDKLLLISITAVGFVRSYSNYFPTSDPRAIVSGVGYLVDLRTNTYEWYQPIYAMMGADRSWDEPPAFPGLTNAYFQVIELAKDQMLRPFTDQRK